MRTIIERQDECFTKLPPLEPKPQNWQQFMPPWGLVAKIINQKFGTKTGREWVRLEHDRATLKLFRAAQADPILCKAWQSLMTGETK